MPLWPVKKTTHVTLPDFGVSRGRGALLGTDPSRRKQCKKIQSMDTSVSLNSQKQNWRALRPVFHVFVGARNLGRVLATLPAFADRSKILITP